MTKFLRNDSPSGCPKKIELLKYEHIIHHFKARDLEILNMLLLSRNDFMNTLRNFPKFVLLVFSRNLNISLKYL